MMQLPKETPFIRPNDIAKFLGISRQAVSQQVRKGFWKHEKIAGHVYIHKSEIEKFQNFFVPKEEKP